MTANTRAAILEATRRLLLCMQETNGFRPHDLASVLFTMTPDLTAAYPAEAARSLGWIQVPLLSAVEVEVPRALPRVVRVLAHWNTTLSQNEISHVYLDEAVALRPDLGENSAGPVGE